MRTSLKSKTPGSWSVMSKYRNVTLVVDDPDGYLWDRLNESGYVEVEHVGETTRVDGVSRLDTFGEAGSARLYTHEDAERPIRTRLSRIQWFEGTYVTKFGGDADA